jgi:hypothetical protein
VASCHISAVSSMMTASSAGLDSGSPARGILAATAACTGAKPGGGGAGAAAGIWRGRAGRGAWRGGAGAGAWRRGRMRAPVSSRGILSCLQSRSLCPLRQQLLQRTGSLHSQERCRFEWHLKQRPRSHKGGAGLAGAKALKPERRAGGDGGRRVFEVTSCQGLSASARGDPVRLSATADWGALECSCAGGKQPCHPWPSMPPTCLEDPPS